MQYRQRAIASINRPTISFRGEFELILFSSFSFRSLRFRFNAKDAYEFKWKQKENQYRNEENQTKMNFDLQSILLKRKEHEREEKK